MAQPPRRLRRPHLLRVVGVFETERSLRLWSITVDEGETRSTPPLGRRPLLEIHERGYIPLSFFAPANWGEIKLVSKLQYARGPGEVCDRGTIPDLRQRRGYNIPFLSLPATTPPGRSPRRIHQDEHDLRSAHPVRHHRRAVRGPNRRVSSRPRRQARRTRSRAGPPTWSRAT